ncbi:MAG: glycogen debranching protein GlgX, partial [Longimicrobiales bacterium]
MSRKVVPGRPYPLGATYDGRGVNFAIYSEDATEVELCLFDSGGTKETERIRLREVTGFIRHGHVAGLEPGQIYGYRIHGPYEPEKGLRFNPSKLLLDPYARAVVGSLDWKGPIFGYCLGDAKRDLSRSDEDDAYAVPKGIVIDES